MKDLLPAERGRKSRPAHDNRNIVNGILWRIRTGAPSRELPEKYGMWMTVYRRFRRWNESGVREAIASTLAEVKSRHLLADKGYDPNAIHNRLKTDGVRATIPSKSNRVKAISWIEALYRHRNRIEQMICHIKINRAVATRYDKLARSFFDALHITTIRKCLRTATS